LSWPKVAPGPSPLVTRRSDDGERAKATEMARSEGREGGGERHEGENHSPT